MSIIEKFFHCATLSFYNPSEKYKCLLITMPNFKIYVSHKENTRKIINEISKKCEIINTESSIIFKCKNLNKSEKIIEDIISLKTEKSNVGFFHKIINFF